MSSTFLQDTRERIQAEIAELQSDAGELADQIARLERGLKALSENGSTIVEKPKRQRKPRKSEPKPEPASADETTDETSTTSDFEEIAVPAAIVLDTTATSKSRADAGATRAAVLAYLGSISPNRASAADVAKQTGLGRGSVSTTLSKLAKAGKVEAPTNRGEGYGALLPF